MGQMIEFSDSKKPRPSARLLIFLLGSLVLPCSGCSLHSWRWPTSPEPIVFSNADWPSLPAGENGNSQPNQNSDSQFEQDPVGTNSDFGNPFPSAANAETDSSTFSSSSRHQRPSMFEVLRSDQIHFYSRQNVRPGLRTLGAAAILANTTMDQEFADWYQDDVRSSSLDEIAEVAKSFGEQWPMVGAYLGASIGGRLVGDDTRLAYWGDHSLRSMFVGVPPLLLLQKTLGSSRPNDQPPSSNWDFWADDNGASGHTFVGAVPFLVAAQMTENRRAKATWIALSTLPGWSRVNDNDHYLSQVIVGWWLAYVATQSVERSAADLNYEIAPVFVGDSAGLEVIWRR
jgi:hypothetical protein